MRYPETLFNSGHAIASPRVYARGQLVLWLADSTVTSLDSPDISHIAIANPGTAPYGVAAEALLRRTGLYARIAKKLVYGESISQVNQIGRDSCGERVCQYGKISVIAVTLK